MGIAASFFALLLIFVNYSRYRDPMYPPVIHSAVWFTVMAIYELVRPAVIDLPMSAHLIFVGGIVAFATGSYMATFGMPAPELEPAAEGKRPTVFMGDILLLVSVVGFGLFFMRALALAASGPFDNFLVNIRYVTGGNNLIDVDPLDSFGPTSYLVPLSVVVVGIQFFLADEERGKWRYYLSIIVALAYAILATGRTYIMIIALVILGLNMISRRMKAKKGLGIFIGASAALFITMGLALGKIAGFTVEQVMEQVQIYTLNALGAFGQHVQTARNFDWGTNTFRTPLLVARLIGIDVTVPELVKEYRYVPLPTNVYTFYRPYFDDFGYVGTMVAALLAGYAHGAVYKRAVSGSTRAMLAYALLLYPLIMQFFQDQYFSLFSSWVQYAFWVALGFAGAQTFEFAKKIVRRPEPEPNA